jgi:hypothetical protein
LLLLVLQGRELFRRCWQRTLAKHHAGLSSERAQLLLDVMVKLASVKVRLITLTIKAAAEAEASSRAEAANALREAEEIEMAARELLEFVSAPPAPVDKEDLARARAEWERGEGLAAEEMIARRKARRPA